MELSDAPKKAPAKSEIDPGTFQLVAQCLNPYANTGEEEEIKKRSGLVSGATLTGNM
jgi:hypothetical protein